jgi:hypothetical protein
MQNYTPTNQGKSDDVDEHQKTMDRTAIQREMIMIEGDQHKFAREKSTLEMEIRQLKKDEAHIRMNLQEKQTHLGKVENELLQLDNQIKSLRKKLNLL